MDEINLLSNTHTLDDTELQSIGLKSPEKAFTRTKPTKCHETSISKSKLQPKTKREIVRLSCNASFKLFNVLTSCYSSMNTFQMMEYSKNVAASRLLKEKKCSFRTPKVVKFEAF